MSDKITAKNLSYDQTLPPFLARLRGQHQAPGDGPDPILAARRRTARVRTASEEAEDAPLVLDEAGNVVDMNADELPGKEDDADAKMKKSEKEEEEKKEQQPTKEAAAIGASKKRKVGRVIGGDDDEKGEREVSQAVKAAKAIAGSANGDKKKVKATTAATSSTPKPSGGKKKAKKIKLSFGDDEAD
ncbi:uncharacterized protein PG998_007467 [Apiospora kogelbergensis]|uniref:DUF4604 domain-containing protein n=1 Tax=Apiospora kogelbergensis TaxID=1337665 RepID=A0AAW0QD86_9PEZI